MINRPQIYGTSKWIKSDSESSRMFFDSFEHMRHNFLSQKYEFSYQATRKATILYNIPAEQCPQDLAYFLIEIHDVLDGDKSKITKENIEYDASNNETQPSAEIEVELQGKFSGGKEEEEKGKMIFEIIEKKYRKEHKAYPLFVPYDKRQQQSYLI
ncbi:hypothetical protein GLOIN_2v1780395 [Rhizophagus irregularis DAOM 181602=DAOM 197198]|uniref:Uncharacterized protein n=1 Tax=Rhizophagus irregularis (strain DAOM 181602 / DAOM 197198 / MUCL 43194) TaxID=747089 RepID=A0A2P4PMH0_RHIID|nr:hypothetical protein GLOIN_2v1780395 [Rhizophagus irregularis DAOM 181602=DAOM 197198]POG66557.1 hypothetical protein GLOIN_2v1780395 [Rhizophagus irregularis DAOM 181602=DAOM 197198]|eukprot:XP_025173423.1 hypothetical protein GLOIN_2v1780395 [Rhizophagus irregularis DAOM 181602=DAOM 197198]